MIRLLIVDDHPSVRQALVTFFHEDPLIEVVGQAEDGNEAIIFAAGLHPDVIVIDREMPGRTGPEALPELRRVSPESKVILFTATEVSGEAFPGFDALLSKSDGPRELRATIISLTPEASS